MKLFLLLSFFVLSGCSSKSTPSYHEPGCGRADAFCLVELAAHAIEGKNSAKKCSDMQGEQKTSCENQVESLKKHISNASNK